MSSDPRTFLEFLERQRPKHAARFPALKVDQILSFMATTSAPGTHATCSVHPLLGVDRGPGARELRVSLGGSLPRAATRGECLTVHMTRVERYQGYQVKTAELGPGSDEQLFQRVNGGLVVKGAQIYTVHHSPYTLQFFESIPFEDIVETVSGLRYALVAMGVTANLSPRFVFHREVKDGKLVLFHGDGLALKTYMNVRQNRSETRIVVDLDDFTGFAVKGTVEEFAPHQHREAFERICQGFQAGGWGKPSRVFRFTADDFEPLAPRVA